MVLVAIVWQLHAVESIDSMSEIPHTWRGTQHSVGIHTAHWQPFVDALFKENVIPLPYD